MKVQAVGTRKSVSYTHLDVYKRQDDNIADINRFKRIGYTFTGYNTSADGSGSSYKENDVIDKTCLLYTSGATNSTLT